jgi:hypothetical protein
MKKIVMLIISFLMVGTCLFANELESDKKLAVWKNNAAGNISFSQVGLDNWTVGGENSLSWNWDLRASFIKNEDETTWENNFKFAYGMIQLGGKEPQKSADEMRVESVYKFKNDVIADPYISLTVLSQLATGTDYTNEPYQNISFFFDPAYFTESLGFEYKLQKEFSTRFGVALKQTLANMTSLTSSKSEGGAEFVAKYKNKFFEKISFESTLQMFSSFKSISGTDIYLDTALAMNIAENINWVFNFNVIYDKDRSDKRQISQTLAIGIKYILI